MTTMKTISVRVIMFSVLGDNFETIEIIKIVSHKVSEVGYRLTQLKRQLSVRDPLKLC